MYGQLETAIAGGKLGVTLDVKPRPPAEAEVEIASEITDAELLAAQAAGATIKLTT